MADCRHPFTTWNEQDGTLYCESCHSWVLPDDVVDEPEHNDGSGAGESMAP